MRVAIDTGGTFTDCVYLAGGELRVLKLFSTPMDPAVAVLDGLMQIAAGQSVEARHGTTVATNAMLERKGARVAFVTTAGFEDTIAIGRQTRAKLYDWFAPVPTSIIPRELRFGIHERVSAEGKILYAPTDEELAALRIAIASSGAESVAISLLFSFANPETEQRIEASLKSLALPISVSHRILPEFREYERASTTVINAYLAPRVESYIKHLERSLTARNSGSRVSVMQSSGGIVPARLAAQEPVRTVLSGPAGGVIGACHMARLASFNRIIGIDMGGTSTDVFLADTDTGGPQLTRESIIAGMPIGIPMLDIHTVGAGGGSIARFDAGGMLRVGPESAGADPGPICFGLGNQPTVTDANLILGRLDTTSFLGGGVELNDTRTREILLQRKGALATLETFASGILRVVETHMENAIRVISIERGHDPRDFTLVAFGGGGPLHACALARALRISTVLIPAMPGALSAVGILLADTVRDYSRTVMLPGDSIHQVENIFAELEARGIEEFATEGLEGIAQRTLDIRYNRQGYELNLAYDSHAPDASLVAFHQLHQQRYGFCHPQKQVEIVNLRLRMTAAGEPYTPSRHPTVPGDGSAALIATRPVYFDNEVLSTGIYRRDLLVSGDTIHGPAMITEYTSATLLPPQCSAFVDGYGNLILSIAQEKLS